MSELFLYGSLAKDNEHFFYINHRDGDLYAALRDCHSALQIDPNHLKAHFRLARCLYELSWPQEAYDCLQQFKNKFPDYAKSNACETLDKDIKAAIYSKTDSGKRIYKMKTAIHSKTDSGNRLFYTKATIYSMTDSGNKINYI